MKCLILAVTGFLLMLAGCEPVVTGYVYLPPQKPEAQYCINECALAQDYCHQGCDIKQHQCVNLAQAQAFRDYDKYTVHQYALHEPITLKSSDFENRVPCDNATKDCRSDCDINYGACYANCGGAISETTYCPFICF